MTINYMTPEEEYEYLQRKKVLEQQQEQEAAQQAAQEEAEFIGPTPDPNFDPELHDQIIEKQNFQQGQDNFNAGSITEEESDAEVQRERNRGSGLYFGGPTGFEVLAKNPIGMGLADTAIGLLSGADWLAGKMIGKDEGLTPLAKASSFWHKENPWSNNPLNDTVRKISGVLIPSLMGVPPVIKGASALPAAAQLPGAVKTAGSIAATLGLESMILGASSTSDEESISNMANEYLGWNLPWVTRTEDGPDARKLLNHYENAALIGGGYILKGLFKGFKWLKNKPASVKEPKIYLTWEEMAKGQRVPTAADEPVKTVKMKASYSQLKSKTREEVAQVYRDASEAIVDPGPTPKAAYDDLKAPSRTKVANVEAANAVRNPKGLATYDELKLKPGERVEWDSDLSFIAKNEEGAEALAKSADDVMRQGIDPAALADDLEADPFIKQIKHTENVRNRAVAEEAAEHLEVNKGEYDPMIHEPSPPTERAQTVGEAADPLGALYDNHRILNDLNTTNGVSRAMLSTKGMRDFLKAADGTARGDFLNELVAKLSPSKNLEAVIEGKWKVTPEQLRKSVDEKVAQLYNMQPAQLAKTLNTLKSKVTLGAEFLGDEEFIEYSYAFREVFDQLYDPDKIRASAMVAQQAADSVSSAAQVSNMLDGVVDVTRFQENLIDNLAVVAKETRANRYLWGYQGKLLNMAKSKDPNVAQKLVELVDDFNEGLKRSHESTSNFIGELKAINRENPEYLKAFTKAYDLTDGDVDTIGKLYRWAEENVSLSKMIYDHNPEIPSLLAQGIHGIRYNSMLNGLAPVRAAMGNTILTVGKPVTALAGSAFSPSRAADVQRALYTYGGVMENLNRAFKHMAKEWSYVVANPEQAMLRGRHDVKFAQSENFEVLEAMAEGWRENGEIGKLGLLNMAKFTSWYNDNKFMRWGLNMLHAIDGFTNSMMASGMARANAYDEIFESTKGSLAPGKFDELFTKKQAELYDKAFDKTGLLTDEAARHAASEIALNLDNKVVKKLDNLIAHVPALKPLFMFPRTGINGLQMAWSYNPISALGLSIGKARQVFEAVTPAQMTDALRAHGIDEFSQPAFQALKNEYRGRQVMGAAVVSAAGFAAANGNLTGNGPHDAEEKRDMMRLGWKPTSIRINGEWYSYRGLEPYQQTLSMVADVIYNADRVDSAITEDWLRKIGYSISMNVTNQSFLSGMAPLVGLINGDETQQKRFLAGWVDTAVPFYWSGARSILNKAISPQLKDVDNEITEYWKNNSKFLFSSNDDLKDQLDIYTGDRINYHEPLTAAVNSVLPFFKSNGGTEPFRQWLIDSGWSNLQTLRTNRLVPGMELSSDERYFINNWVAKHSGLKEQIERLMELDKSGKYTEKYVDARGQKKQKEFPIDQSFIHRKLDQMHTKAFNNAWRALELNNSQYTRNALLEKYKRKQLNRGNTTGADQTQDKIRNLLELQ